jgi:hypothetical protein
MNRFEKHKAALAKRDEQFVAEVETLVTDVKEYTRQHRIPAEVTWSAPFPVSVSKGGRELKVQRLADGWQATPGGALGRHGIPGCFLANA